MKTELKAVEILKNARKFGNSNAIKTICASNKELDEALAELQATQTKHKNDCEVAYSEGFLARADLAEADRNKLDKLQFFEMVPGFAEAEGQVDLQVGEDFQIALAIGQCDLIGVDQQGLVGVEAEIPDVIVKGIIPETVMLGRVDGVKLPGLDEPEAPQVGAGRIL